MTKRKSDAEKASNQRSRKRMAFTAPKSAATKAIIQRNAQSSPLLRLPLEIRRKIFVEVLGDRLIHLKNTSRFDFDWDMFVCDPAAADPIKRLRPEQKSRESGNNTESSDDTDSRDDIDSDDTDSDDTDSSGFYDREIYGTDMGEDPGLRSAIDLESDTEDSSDEEEDGSDEEEHVSDEEEHGNVEEEHGNVEEEDGNHVMGDQGSSSDGSEAIEDIKTRSPFFRKPKWTAEEVERMYHRKVQHMIGHATYRPWLRHKDSIVTLGKWLDPKRCRYDCEMHLRLLRTCRQIYTEADQVLWETNIFSFNDVRTFGRFMDTRSTHQKGLIKKIRLVMKLGSRSADQQWNGSLTMPLVRSLQGLRFLWLYINERQSSDQFEEYGQIMMQSKSREGLRKLATLPLTHVSVAITSKELDLVYWDPIIYPRELWTRQQQEKYAELIRSRLLDVDGVKLLQQENDEVKAFWVREKEREAARTAMRRPLPRNPSG